MSDSNKAVPSPEALDEERRDFLLIATCALGAVGAGLAAWPFVSSMNPAADVLALSTTTVDLTPVQVGQAITVIWRGKRRFGKYLDRRLQWLACRLFRANQRAPPHNPPPMRASNETRVRRI
jgi:hypothetical protein